MLPSLRPATAEDLPFLLQLRLQTMTPHQLGSGLTVSLREQKERVAYRFECARVVELEGQPVGIFKVARDGLDWQLVQIQLLPRVQSRGLGRRLIEALMDEARAAGARLSLHVLHANPARRLYERLGFRVTAVGAHESTMVWEPLDAATGSDER